MMLSLFALLLAPWLKAQGDDSRGCTATREYITALEYLRQDKNLSVAEAQARKIASDVALGCTGAADRFIRVTRTLNASGLSGADAAKTGLSFTPRTDREVETFVAVFRRAFLKEGLDLDLLSSMRLARSLTTEFEGDILAVRDDFETLLDYCLDEGKLGLPRPRCGSFAADLARKGQNYSGGVSRPFIRAFEFLVGAKGTGNNPEMTRDQALELAQAAIASGPDGADNFIQGYRYATSPKGLDLPRNDALAFARKMALATVQPEVAAPVPAKPASPANRGTPTIVRRKLASDGDARQ